MKSFPRSRDHGEPCTDALREAASHVSARECGCRRVPSGCPSAPAAAGAAPKVSLQRRPRCRICRVRTARNPMGLSARDGFGVRRHGSTPCQIIGSACGPAEKTMGRAGASRRADRHALALDRAAAFADSIHADQPARPATGPGWGRVSAPATRLKRGVAHLPQPERTAL